MACLRDEDFERFARDGYLLVPDVVPEDLAIPADEEIDALVEEMEPTEGDRCPGVSAWFVRIARLPNCDAVLRRSCALSIAEELVAPNRLDHAFDHIQVSTTRAPWSHVPGGPHIDGQGIGQEPPGSFTLLAGVLLSDQRADESGALWVWPGSHLDHVRLFHERGTRALQSTGGHATLLDPPLRLPPPIPIRGSRGDLLLAHYLLGHNKGGNTAPHTRRTLYYRLAAERHRDRWEETFVDAWAEFPPVRRHT